MKPSIKETLDKIIVESASTDNDGSFELVERLDEIGRLAKQLLKSSNKPDTNRLHTSYRLNVTGRLWSGAPGDYTYQLPDNPAKHPATLAECKPLCGDFESLDTAEIERVEVSTTITSKELQ